MVRHSRTARTTLVLVFGLAVLATGGWFAWNTLVGNSSNQLVSRLPEINVSELSQRARKVILSCQESVRLAPEDASSWGLLGRAYLAHQFQDEARQCFEIAGELEPDNDEWYYSQALTYIPNDNQVAMQKIRKAMELADKNLDQLQCRLAELLFEESEFDDCRTVIESVLKSTPGHLRASMLQARLFLMENQLQESLRSAEIVILGQPQRQEALRLLSQIHSRLGNAREANRFAAAAEKPQSYNEPWPDEVNEKIQSLRKDINQLVANAMRLPPAKVMQKLQILKEAVEEEPHEPQWHVFLGQTLLQVRDFEQAKKVMKKAVELHADSAIVHYTLGLVWLNEGKPKQAIPILEKTVELKSDYAGAYCDLGIAYRLDNRFGESIEAFERSIKILPGNFKSQLNLAVTLEINGQVDEAIQSYLKCLEIDNQSADVCLLLGKLYKQKKEIENAKKYLQRALELDAGLVEANELLNSF